MPAVALADPGPIAFTGESADVRAQIRDVDAYAGARLREARRASGVTLRRLGESLGVSIAQVAGYERGVNRMSAGTLAAAAAVVGRDVAWFFEEPADA